MKPYRPHAVPVRRPSRLPGVITLLAALIVALVIALLIGSAQREVRHKQQLFEVESEDAAFQAGVVAGRDEMLRLAAEAYTRGREDAKAEQQALARVATEGAR